MSRSSMIGRAHWRCGVAVDPLDRIRVRDVDVLAEAALAEPVVDHEHELQGAAGHMCGVPMTLSTRCPSVNERSSSRRAVAPDSL